MAARNTLGETFGTKKRRQQIRARERNMVDVDNLDNVADIIKAEIDDNVVPGAAVGAEAGGWEERGVVPYNVEVGFFVVLVVGVCACREGRVLLIFLDFNSSVASGSITF